MAKRRPPDRDPPRKGPKTPLVGPRGGQTTRKPGQIKKTVWLHEDEAAQLRRAAYETFRSEASLIREALRQYFRIED